MNASSLGPLIAIVGSDGAGKSTVGEALLNWMRESRPTEMCHLGKKTGDIGRAIARWPLVGGKLDRTIRGQAKTAREKGPNAFSALAIYLISMRRVRKFRRMMAIRRRGTTILADRYPQTSIPGPMDGPGIFDAGSANGIVRKLARRERAHYARMASFLPDLVIRLNVDLETAAARKPDHRYSSLKKKIETVPLLSFGGAPIVDIDSTQPLAQVIDQAKQAITAALAKRQ